MSRRIAGLLAAPALAFGLALAPAGPAAATYNDCAAFPGTICFHEHATFTGQVWRQFPTQINGCRNLGNDGFDNKASTLFNQSTGYALVVWQFNNCSGNFFVASAGTFYIFANSTPENNWWNDRISSIEVIGL